MVDDPDIQLGALATVLRNDLDDLTDDLTKVIFDRVAYYRETSTVSPAEVRLMAGNHLAFVLDDLGSDQRKRALAEARGHGRLRGASGFPLAPLIDACRVGFQWMWEVVVERSRRGELLSPEAIVRIASDIWQLQDAFAEALAAGHRDAAAELVLTREQERSAVVAALLDPSASATMSSREAAELLRIPQRGPYVVVVAETAATGREALPEAESRLHAVGVASAWRLLPDLQVAIACVPRPDLLTRLVTVLERRGPLRVGVSPPYDDLLGTETAQSLARVAMRGSLLGRPAVTMFDTQPLAVAAVSSPDVMSRMVTTVLGALRELPPADRRLLLDTFEAYLDAGGVVGRAAERLHCHPNTVRQRLHRLERWTGRSLSDPLGTAELCLAFEAERRLYGPPDNEDSVPGRANAPARARHA